MKSTGVLKWKLGLFIVAGLVLLVLGLYFIGKQKNLFVSVFPIKAVFNNVSGLKVGNNVRFGGIAVGTVDGIQLLTDTSVEVNMNIKSEVRKFIKRDASASIGSDGLVGDRVVVGEGLGAHVRGRHRHVVGQALRRPTADRQIHGVERPDVEVRVVQRIHRPGVV